MKFKNINFDEDDLRAFAEVMRTPESASELDDEMEFSLSDQVIDVFGGLWNPSKQLYFEEDAMMPNILNGTNGTRIIKSNSGKFRVYSVTGTLLGIRDTEQAAKKLATK